MTLFHSRLDPPNIAPPPSLSSQLKLIHRRFSILSHLRGFTPAGAAPYSHSFHSLSQAGKVEPIPLSPAKSRGIRASWGEKDTAF